MSCPGDANEAPVGKGDGTGSGAAPVREKAAGKRRAIAEAAVSAAAVERPGSADDPRGGSSAVTSATDGFPAPAETASHPAAAQPAPAPPGKRRKTSAPADAEGSSVKAPGKRGKARKRSAEVSSKARVSSKAGVSSKGGAAVPAARAITEAGRRAGPRTEGTTPAGKLGDGTTAAGEQSVVLQVGALCCDDLGQVLLITSRGTGRWVIPKGWPMCGRTLAEAAMIEAWEEAGIRATPEREIGTFRYDKTRPRRPAIPVAVRVFLARVDKVEERFPESRQRRRSWFAPSEAALLVAELELAAILRALPDPADAGPPDTPAKDGAPGRGHPRAAIP